jgi:hypothetical protein
MGSQLCIEKQMAPRVSTDLKTFANHLVEHYAPSFESIQRQICTTYRFDFEHDGEEHLFELTHTTVHQGNVVRDTVFFVFGCILNGHFYWTNQMNQHWKPVISEYKWSTDVSALFDTICVTDVDPRTIPYLVSLTHAPECNVVRFRSTDGIELFAVTDLVMAAEPHIAFDVSSLILTRNSPNLLIL